MSYYPTRHFPGTPRWLRRAVRRTLRELNIPARDRYLWRHALEAISRYESDCNPAEEQPWGYPSLTGQDPAQYSSARGARPDLVPFRPDYTDVQQALVTATLYVDSKLLGFGGYHGVRALLERDDRGPGAVLRYWRDHPDASYSEMRPYYRGY